MTNFKKYIKFDKKILMLGHGSVGQCTLPLLLRHIEIDPKNITVLEAHDKTEQFMEEYKSSGIKYVVQEITKKNLRKILRKHLKKGDFLIDLSTDIDAINIIDWCQKRKVMYLNTSLEDWPGEFQSNKYDHHERTLYNSHYKIRNKAKGWKEDGPTAVVTHGANPGLVSHFTKKALVDVAEAMDLTFSVPQNKEEWAILAERTGTKVIHISERDTQVSHQPKLQDEFVNTWSVVGFWAEGVSPAEMGWGTHETWEPNNMKEHTYGPKNAKYLLQPGATTLVRSWVPLGGDIVGYCIQHSEAITISEYLTLELNDKVVYRPTVHYAYHPCDAAIVSMHELMMREWDLQPKLRIMENDIISGIDELGVLLMGHGKNAWWYGSQLSIEETRMLIPNQNATTLQVAASVLAATVWTIKNPNKGYCEPEDLPHDFILDIAGQYLGPMPSIQSDWKPTEGRSPLFDVDMDLKNIWSFRNFLLK